MAKTLTLRFTKMNTTEKEYWDSNLVILNGVSGVHLELPGTDCDVTIFQSMIGTHFVTVLQDYFGDLWDKILPYPGIGQVIKFRVNKPPTFGQIIGDIEDGGDVNPDDPDDILNAFAGMEGQYFLCKEGSFFVGKSNLN